MAGICNPGYSGDWGRRIAWAHEAEVAVNKDCTTALQPGWQTSSQKKESNFIGPHRWHRRGVGRWVRKLYNNILKYFIVHYFFPLNATLYFIMTVLTYTYQWLQITVSAFFLSFFVFSFFLFFSLTESGFVAYTGVQWCHFSSLQPLPPGFKRFSYLNLLSS